MWAVLSLFAQHISQPWIIAGDFNCVLGPSEKIGGTVSDCPSTTNFQNFVTANDLEEAGFIGSKFTWFNGRHGGGIWARLDRALFNAEWSMMFLATNVEHLSCSCSDHSSMLINLFDNQSQPPARFCFQCMWSTHASFLQVVSTTWTAAPIASNPLVTSALKLKALWGTIRT